MASLDSGIRAYHQSSVSANFGLTRGDPLRVCLVQYDLGSGNLEQDPECELSSSPLQLPSRSELTSDACQSLAAVRFLEPFNNQDADSCPIQLTSGVCSAASRLNLIPGKMRVFLTNPKFEFLIVLNCKD